MTSSPEGQVNLAGGFLNLAKNILYTPANIWKLGSTRAARADLADYTTFWKGPLGTFNPFPKTSGTFRNLQEPLDPSLDLQKPLGTFRPFPKLSGTFWNL